jgi:hypothetical protein
VIVETTSPRGRPAWTSDRWHVVLARWSGDDGARARFDRTIVSEHDDHGAAVGAARQWLAQFAQQSTTRPREHCDQVFVRQPRFRTLRRARRHERRRGTAGPSSAGRKSAKLAPIERPFGDGIA